VEEGPPEEQEPEVAELLRECAVALRDESSQFGDLRGRDHPLSPDSWQGRGGHTSAAKSR
jgi:hypothetical protein